MNTRRLVAAVATAGALLLSSCTSGSVPTADLQEIVDAQWQVFAQERDGLRGGLAIQVLAPQGDFFLTTGPDGARTNTEHFRTASVTKTFTAAAIMLLAERGVLNIDERLTDNIPGTDTPYVPDTPAYAIPNKDQITIKLVLQHRAGIFDLSNQNIQENDASRGQPYVGANYLEWQLEQDPEHQFTFDELFGVIAANAQVGFEEPVGSKYQYSDTGYNLLAVIVERVSGFSFEEFVRDELLIPNKLSETTLPWRGDDQTVPEPFASGFVWYEGAALDTTISNMSPFVGNGNIITTPLDLANWGERLFTGTAGLAPATVELMKTGLPVAPDSTSTYGLGVTYSEQTGYGHSGAHEGYLSRLSYLPEIETTCVVLMNIWDLENGMDSLIAQLAFMSETAGLVIDRLAE